MKPSSKIAARRTKNSETVETTTELHEQICRRAYELYEQRGRNGEHELDDWLQAESELTRKTSKTVAA